MTYNELLEKLPLTLVIPTLGGKATLTIINLKTGLMAENSKGSSYHLSREDWTNAKRIRNSYPHKPWSTSLYAEPSSLFSYGLPYAAALLRHVEGGHTSKALDSPLPRFIRRTQSNHAA